MHDEQTRAVYSDTLQESLAEEVKRGRERRGWTPEQLAAYAGVSGPTIRAIEACRTRPFASTMRKVRAALEEHR